MFILSHVATGECASTKIRQISRKETRNTKKQGSKHRKEVKDFGVPGWLLLLKLLGVIG